MAFSYSDKNFTVVGNLCFVHIQLDGTTKSFDIPPAICDRMLFDVVCAYPYYAQNKVRGAGGGSMPNISFALIKNGKIKCLDVGTGYLSFFFPIDSNK